MASADVQRVEVRLYDVSRGLASQLSGPVLGRQIEGIYHTTTVVNGVEYSYGPGTLTRSFPGQNPFLRGTPARVIDVGTTTLGPAILDELLRSLETRYNADTYDVVFNNCVQFTNELVQVLTGQQLPDDVLNQLQDVIATPMGEALLRVLSGETPPSEFLASHGDLLHDIMRNLFGGGGFGGGFGGNWGAAARGQGAEGAGNAAGDAAPAAGEGAAGAPAGGTNAGGPFSGGFWGFPFFAAPWMRRGGGFWGCGPGACGSGFGGRAGGCWESSGCGAQAKEGDAYAKAEAGAGASGSGPKTVPVTTAPSDAPTAEDSKGKGPASSPTAPPAPNTAAADSTAAAAAADTAAAAAAPELMGGLTVEAPGAAATAMEEAPSDDGSFVVVATAPAGADEVRGAAGGTADEAADKMQE